MRIYDHKEGRGSGTHQTFGQGPEGVCARAKDPRSPLPKYVLYLYRMVDKAEYIHLSIGRCGSEINFV